MQELEPGTLRLLRQQLGEGSRALPFVEAVVAQVAHPPGRRGPLQAERDAAERVLRLVGGADSHDVADTAASLAAEPVLLAAFFQNVDLLYLHGSPRGDAVSDLIMRALERIQQRPDAVER